MSATPPFGIPPARLRQRPYLHLDPTQWDRLRERLGSPQHTGLQLCRLDCRPGPARAPRFATAVLEAAAFVAAVTGARGDVEFLKLHLDLVLASRGMDMIGVLRGHFLSALAFSYDVLGQVLDEPDLAGLRRTLTDHAHRAAEAIRVGLDDRWPMESPKTVATLAGLNLAGLCLLGEEPDAAAWLEVSDQRLEAMLQQVAGDGWWPTGWEDWNLLLPLLVRVADAWERLAQRDRFDHGLFREAWAVALHGLAPNGRDVLDLDHVGKDGVSRRQAVRAGQPGGQYRWCAEPCTWALERLAQRFAHPGFRLAAGHWRALGLGRGSPWTALFSAASQTSGTALGRPYHIFDAHGLAVWRADWAEQSPCLAFATGPAYGQSDRSWQPITPLDGDANHFLWWLQGESVVDEPARAADGSTAFHNTVLVDGQNQLPPAQQRPGSAALAAHWLTRFGGALIGRADGSYPASTGLRLFQRHLAFAADYLVIWDLLAGDQTCRYDWLLHSSGTISAAGGATATIQHGAASVWLQVLRPHRVELKARELARNGEPLGSELRLATPDAIRQTQFLVLLVPCRPGGEPPVTASLVTGESAVGCALRWAGGDVEQVLFPPRGRGIVLDHLLSDAASLALRQDSGGSWRRLIARRTSQVLVPGGEVLVASQPIDIAVESDSVAVEGEVESKTGATLTLRCPFVPRGVLVDGQSGRAKMDRTERLVTVRVTAGRHHLRISGR